MQTLRGSQLRREVVELRDELKRTRASRDWYRKSRDHWKREAAAWRWGSSHGYGIAARRGEDAQASARAEAS